MKMKTILQLICVGLLCLFVCSINSCNRKVYPVTSDEQSLDGRDAAVEGRYTFNDNDTVLLQSDLLGYSVMKGSIYNAINPQYIANIYGATEMVSGNGKHTMSFELDDWNYPSNSDETPLNAAKTWNYIVDSIGMRGYDRAVVALLMSDAMERVEFSTSPRDKYVAFTGLAQDTLLRAYGEVRIRTRHIPGESIETRNARYVLDNIEVTYKIFNALNPVYIRSLKRITDKKKIAQSGYKHCSELVRVNLFTDDEVRAPEKRKAPLLGSYTENDHIAIVDGVQVPSYIAYKLYEHYFKKSEDLEHLRQRGYIEYREKYPEIEEFTIITL
jgi:hypothetical protein